MATKRIRIHLPNAPYYDVRIGAGAVQGLGAAVQELAQPHLVCMIYDEAVTQTAAATVHQQLADAGCKVIKMGIPSGESSKSIAIASELWEAMASAKMGRDDLVVAVGGGVTGDLAGFVASTYMRGLPYIQVPTTLLAMVDSSVGGKTAINLPQGKNLVGTFTQPLHVVADINFLATLPEREWRCGLGEVAKTCMIGPESFYAWMLAEVENLAAHDNEAVVQAICQCVAHKAHVVIEDEKETSGLREQLNYGHTLAHAVEQVAGYGTWSHGHAVAEGMRFAARLGAAVIDTPQEVVSEQDALLDLLGLPQIDVHYGPQELLDAMHADKKARQGKVRFVLPHGQGNVESLVVPDDTILKCLTSWEEGKGAVR